ncbi:MAG: (2Fe-2S)-binding protein [Candidatus Riflebacteria bacterium]|nr:(2Fe-2S)-binding protein [Candidatus Riflebacteria bacterium]
MADIAKVRLTIDGISTEAEKGVLLVEAARRIGIKIPVFCSHSKLLPLGACRICLVEIEKAPKLVTACTTPVGEGMVVFTRSARVVKARQGIVEFLLANHPLDCPICDQGGECELQDVCFEFGRGKSRFEDIKRNFDNKYGRIKLSPVLSWVNNRCIHCERCTRVCHQVVGEDHIGMLNRGDKAMISTFQFTQMTCELCGNCAEVCPTGTITNGTVKYKDRVWNLTPNPSVCLLCSSSCATRVWTDLKGKVTRVTAPKDEQDCCDFLCAKGRFSFDADQGEQRLREGTKITSEVAETFQQSESLQPTVQAFKALAKDSGSTAVIYNSRIANEEAYLVGRIARTVLKTPHVVPLENHEGLTSYLDRFSGRQSTSKDILSADLILLVDAPLARETPMIGYFVTRAVRQKGAALYTVGPEKTRHSSMGLAHHWNAPGASKDFVLSLIEALQSRKSDASAEFNKIVDAVQGSRQMVIIAGSRPLAEGPAFIRAIESLSSKVANSKVLMVPEGGNTLGAMLMAGSGMRVPGWGSNVSQNGCSVQEDVLGAIEKGSIKNVLLIGEDLQEGLINWPRWKTAFAKLANLVVFDAFRSELTSLATLAVPVRSFHEFEGSVLSALGEWKIARGSIPGAVGQSMSRLLLKLESELGGAEQSFASVTSEVKKLYQWHVSRATEAVEDKKSADSAGKDKSTGGNPGKDGVFLLIGNDLYHSGAMTLRGAHLGQFLNRSLLMNSADAEKMKISNDARVQLKIGSDKVSVAVRTTDDIMSGCCFLALNSLSPDERRWFGGIGKPLTAVIISGGAA